MTPGLLAREAVLHEVPARFAPAARALDVVVHPRQQALCPLVARVLLPERGEACEPLRPSCEAEEQDEHGNRAAPQQDQLEHKPHQADEGQQRIHAPGHQASQQAEDRKQDGGKTQLLLRHGVLRQPPADCRAGMLADGQRRIKVSGDLGGISSL